MAYNSYYPPYQPNYFQQPAQQSGSMIWVAGKAGADAFLVAPGTTVALWDSEATVVYLKSADMSGMPSMKIIDYKIREDNNAKEYASIGDINSLKEQISKLQAEIEKMRGASE